MNSQIRKLTIVVLLLFTALFGQLTNLQVIQAGKLSKDPRNTRSIVKAFNSERGDIQTADGVVVARSVPTPGEKFERRREYPTGALFGHVTGYFSFAYGSSGVEKTYSDQLSGRDFRFTDFNKAFSASSTANNVTLTLRNDLQTVARDQLKGRHGAAVVLDPRDGSVLAMYGEPSYDPSPLSGFDAKQVQVAWDALQNDPNKSGLPRAYRQTYSPGSTFKVVTSAAVLDKAPALANKTYPVLSSLTLPQTKRPLRNFGGESCGGQLPELLKKSCNTGFAQIGLDMGARKLHDTAAQFGFNTKSALDLPAAATSIFPDASSFDHDLPALAQSAIGQRDVRATPLQMALVAAGVANQGRIMKPHVMKEIRDANGEVITTPAASQWTTATSPEAANTLTQLMIGVVKSGTARSVDLGSTQVAAKTGTAQTVPGQAHAWMIAFAPADAPTVAVAVIVENQPGVGDQTGGHTAGPIVKALLQAALPK